MNVLTTQAGAPGEQVALLTQQGDALGVLLAPAGSGSSETPLTSAFWCDINSVATGTPDGSIAHPFKSLQAACDACVIPGSTVFLCSLGNVPLVVDLTVTTHNVNIVGVANPLGQIDPLQITGNIVLSDVGAFSLQNVVVNGGIDGSSGDGTDVTLIDAACTGDIQCNNLQISERLARQFTFGGNITAAGFMTTNNADLQGLITCAALVFMADSDPRGPSACQAGGSITSTGGTVWLKNAVVPSVTAPDLEVDGCAFLSNQTITINAAPSTGTVCQIYDSLRPSDSTVITFVVTGEFNDIRTDLLSYNWLSASDLTQFEHVHVLGALEHITTNLAVPNVGAGNVAYVDIDVSLTNLAGITTTDDVKASPTDNLIAAGAGGALVNAWVPALNTVRCTLLGPLTSGNHNIKITRLTRQPVLP